MTKYQLTRPGGPWIYDEYGFTAVDGAILDGDASSPTITSPPDAYWTVYAGGSAETGISRHGATNFLPAYVEPADGTTLAYNAATNQWEYRNPTTIVGAAGVTLQWQPAEIVTTATVRQAPDGSWIKSTANRTTGATFDPTEQGFWTAVAATAGTIEAAALADSFALRTHYLDTDYATLEAALTALPDYATLEIRGTHSRASALVVNQPCQIRFAVGGSITVTAANTHGIDITSSYVTIIDPKLTGNTSAATGTANAIRAIGASAAAPLDHVAVLGDGNGGESLLSTWSYQGVYLKYVTNFAVDGLNCDGIGYAGIMTESAIGGRIRGNNIKNITQPSGYTNSYGIALSRANSDSLTTDPRSARIVVEDNRVDGVLWEGIDTHAGENITIANNHVFGCKVGIAAVASANASSVPTWAPLGVSIRGNTIDSGVSDGSKEAAISFAGAGGTVGSSVQHATGSIVGNTIKGHGAEAISNNGAIYFHDTTGLTIAGNTIIEPSPHAFMIGNDNYGFAIHGNTVVDHWSNTVATPSVFNIPAGYATGALVGNVHRNEGNKAAATYKNVRGYNATTTTGVSIEAHANVLDDCSTPVNGLTGVKSTFRFPVTFQQAIGFGAGSASSPAFYLGTDTDTGFYSVADNQLGITVGGTLRARFTTTAMLLADGINLSFGTTTGTTIGSGASQKLAFYGKTPIVQPSATPAAATDAATTQALVNDLRTKLIALGLIA